MPVDTGTDILTLSNTQAKGLAGRVVKIGGTTYTFKGYDPDHPGQPPWRSGAEGKAYPLFDGDGSAAACVTRPMTVDEWVTKLTGGDGSVAAPLARGQPQDWAGVAAYLKFFTRPTQKRLDRTAWLIGQQMHTWLPHLAAAPLLWTDTRHGYHGAHLDFQFAAYLAKAVPGETWLERKSGIADGQTRFPEDLRWRCVTDLLLALAALERAELVHGDLSPNNVIIDLDARRDEPVLYLIDFDAFFAAAAGANRAVTVTEGGTYGTEGYCPPDLAAAVSPGDFSVAPYSDRYGRDMLLLEFLLMGSSLPSDDPLIRWDRAQLQRQFSVWQARSDPKHVRALGHLEPAAVFTMNEAKRPTSVDLATGLGLSLPERRVLRRVTELTRPTPAIVGQPVAPPTPASPAKSVARTKSARAGHRAAPVRITDVFETLATKRSGAGGNWTEFGGVMAIGAAIVMILASISLVLAIASEPSAGVPKDDFDAFLNIVAGVFGGGTCLGFFLLLSLAFGYFVNRK